MATVLVTDGEERAALSATRSLGAAGHRIFVAASVPRSLAGASRHAHRSAVVPSPLEDPGGFVRALVRETEVRGVDVLLPISEASVRAVLEEREAFGGVRIPFPDARTFRRAARKDTAAGAARSTGLSVPAQHCLADAGAAHALALTYPVVIKPARSVVDGSGSDGGRTKTKVAYAVDARDLETQLAALPGGAFPVLVQERIEGDGVGLFYLMEGGEVRARFAHRRLREKPPSGGVSVLRESVAVDEAWFTAGAELLRNLGYDGVAMVELKVDAESGRPFLIEVNPRLWGSLQLAVDAGVDFPRLLVAQALGWSFQPVLTYGVGVRTRWVLGDLDHLVIRLRGSRRALNLPAHAPGRLREMVAFLTAFGPSVRGEVFRLGDPWPALAEAANWARLR